MAKPKNLGPRIKEALLAGKQPVEICGELQVSKGTVAYHANIIGVSNKHKRKKRYDWNAVKEYLSDHGVRETINFFGMSNCSWWKAVKRGDVPMKPLEFEPDKVFVPGKARHALKRGLIKIGRASECNKCNITEWMGLPISLQLDHIDGNTYNNEPSNLRFLCPNCHSQTETFAGRNKKYKIGNSVIG